MQNAEPSHDAPLIVVVDDDPDFLEICRHVLQSRGYRLKCASDPDEALTLMRTEKPRLVLSDLMMKTLDSGFLFARQLKEDERFKDVPVLIITGVAGQRGFDFQPRSPEDLAAMRADGFLAKPVTPDTLLSKVRELIGPAPA